MKPALPALAAILLLPALGGVAAGPGMRAGFDTASAPDLYAEAAAATLARSFPSPRLEYLMLDLRTGRVVAMRWADSGQPIPAGSLFKPFVALAYAQMHSGPGTAQSPSPALSLSANRSEGPLPQRDPDFPVFYCHGSRDGCWRPAGHGQVRLEQALAVSCNAYFLALAREVAAPETGRDAMERVSAAYGLPSPWTSEGDRSSQDSAAMLIGRTPEWRVTPLQLVRAYARLAQQPREGVAARLLAGMRMAAQPGGTAARIGAHREGVLAKTGTAPCVPSPAERCAVNGDGLALAIFPADEPREVLLVRERSTTGAEAARIAGKMLSRLEAMDAGGR